MLSKTKTKAATMAEEEQNERHCRLSPSTEIMRIATVNNNFSWLTEEKHYRDLQLGALSTIYRHDLINVR